MQQAENDEANRKKKSNLTFAILLIILAGCSNHQKRGFFINMKNRFDDVKIDSSSYFLKGFGLSTDSKIINGIPYWNLRCEKRSLFYLAGFLREVNDSIMLLPVDYDVSSQPMEFKLFDLSETTDTIHNSWSLFLNTSKNILSGYDVVNEGVSQKDSILIHTFLLKPFDFYKGGNIKRNRSQYVRVSIAKDQGILNILMFNAEPFDTMYYLNLFPEEFFLNRMGNKVTL